MRNLTHLLEFLPEHPAISWVPFHQSHVSQMKLAPNVTRSLSKALPLDTMLANQAKHGHAVTAYLHSTPAACFGCVDIWEGVAEMWLLVEERARKYGKTMTRAAIGYRDFIVLSRNLHRLQVTVRSDSISAVNWAKLIGFEPECVMRRYGADQSDFILMSRV